MVKYKVGHHIPRTCSPPPPVSFVGFVVSKSVECDTFPFSALTLLVGRQEQHPAC